MDQGRTSWCGGRAPSYPLLPPLSLPRASPRASHFLYLPERHTDFIFAIIGEEFGLIGCILVIGLFAGFTYRGFFVSFMCEDKYGRLLAIGITSAIAIQAFINMAVATAVMPPTGITLPLTSSGGSSTLTIFLMLGILLNISRKRIQRLHTNVH